MTWRHAHHIQIAEKSRFIRMRMRTRFCAARFLILYVCEVHGFGFRARRPAGPAMPPAAATPLVAVQESAYGGATIIHQIEDIKEAKRKTSLTLAQRLTNRDIAKRAGRKVSTSRVVTTLEDEEQYMALINKATAEDRTVVIKIHASWCRACKAVGPKYEKTAGRWSTQETQRPVEFYSLLFDDNKKLCLRLGVKTLPVMEVIAGKQGKVSHFQCGPKKFAEGALDEAIEAAFDGGSHARPDETDEASSMQLQTSSSGEPSGRVRKTQLVQAESISDFLYQF